MHILNSLLFMSKVFKAFFISAVVIVVYVGNVLCVEVDVASEYEVKAAFIYNFARFIEWPDICRREEKKELVLCILGSDPFGSALDIIRNKTIGDKKLVIRMCKDIKNLDSCHILFISASEKERSASILKFLKSSCILTISDIEGFAQSGGIINFVIEENKVRFEINIDAANRAGIKISSKVLKLAKIIKESQSP